MARVLWVTALAPGLQGGGGHVRQAHLITALAERAEVHLLVSGEFGDEQVREAVTSVKELTVHEDDWSGRHRALRRSRDLWLATGSSQPREVAPYGPVRRVMSDHIDRFDGDAVVVETAGLAPLVGRRRRAAQVWIVDLHNVGSQMAAQEAAVAPGRRQQWLHTRDAAKARRWQSTALAPYDRVVTVSDDDRRLLSPHLPVSVVANGVDGREFPVTPIPAAPALVFIGALHTGPNVDGVRWFCTEILPHVVAAEPDATVTVVGARPTRRVADLDALPGVRVVADVASTVPYLQSARVALVPLRIGSGTRLKALEAMAAGRPVVGTSIGLAGLGMENGRHALIADAPASFADSVVRLLREDALAARLAIEGRALVDRHYDWLAIGHDFADMVFSTIKSASQAWPPRPGPTSTQ